MARKAERKALDQAADQYYKALKKAKPIEGAQDRAIDSSSARKIEERIGDDLSYGTKRLAMQADKLGRGMNKLQPKFKASVDAYNQRYEVLKGQMSGKPATAIINEKSGKLQSQIQSVNEGFQSKHANNPLAGGNYTTDIMGNKKPGLLSQEGIALDAANKELAQLPSKYGAIANWRKTLPAMETAATELNELSGNVSKNKDYINLSGQYNDIADKLKAKLRRDVNTVRPQNPTGLLGQSEVISGNSNPIANETLR